MRLRIDMPDLMSSVFVLMMSVSLASATEVSDALLREYQQAAAKPFSANNGEILWRQDLNGRSCTSCHSDSVKAPGRHKRTGKVIEPMSPTENVLRLTDSKKIEKWFLRNCKWTFGRECTVQEKGDILLWLSQQ